MRWGFGRDRLGAAADRELTTQPTRGASMAMPYETPIKSHSLSSLT